MNFWEQIVSGFTGLMLHKMRSFLTMLGIIFGVGAVVAMVAVGEGAKEETLRQIQAFGARTLYVRAVDPPGEKRNEAKRRGSVGLSLADRDYLLAVCPFVLRAAPQVISDEMVVCEGRQPQAQVVGVDRAYGDITGARPYRGRFIGDADVELRRNVCVIGWEVYRELFVDRPAVGSHVKIGGRRFDVVGVMPMKATSARAGAGKSAGAQIKTRDVDRDVYVPVTAALEQFQGIIWRTSAKADLTYHRVRELTLEVRTVDEVRSAKATVETLLKDRHGGIDDVEVVAPLEDPRAEPQGPEPLQSRPRLHRGALPPRGRHRHHEHHAGQRDGTDQGDRHPPLRGGHPGGHSRAVPLRGPSPSASWAASSASSWAAPPLGRGRELPRLGRPPPPSGAPSSPSWMASLVGIVFGIFPAPRGRPHGSHPGSAVRVDHAPQAQCSPLFSSPSCPDSPSLRGAQAMAEESLAPAPTVLGGVDQAGQISRPSIDEAAKPLPFRKSGRSGPVWSRHPRQAGPEGNGSGGEVDLHFRRVLP